MPPAGKIAICETLGKSIVRTQSKIAVIDRQMSALERTIRSAQKSARESRNTAMLSYLNGSIDLIAASSGLMYVVKRSARASRIVEYGFTAYEVIDLFRSFKKAYHHLKRAQNANTAVALAIRQADSLLDNIEHLADHARWLSKRWNSHQCSR